MSKNWISNTIYIHGFQDIQELFDFLSDLRDYPRTEDGFILLDGNALDLEYITINISNIQNKLRLSLSFLTDSNIVRQHAPDIYPSRFQNLKMTHAVIDTRTEAVELYNFAGSEMTSHKSVPRGLGRPLLDELERLPDPDKNLSLSVQDIDVLDFAVLEQMIRNIYPQHSPAP